MRLYILILFLVSAINTSYAQTISKNTNRDLTTAFAGCLSFLANKKIAYEELDKYGQRLSINKSKKYLGRSTFEGNGWLIKEDKIMYGIFTEVNTSETCTVVPYRKISKNFHMEYKTFLKELLKQNWIEDNYKKFDDGNLERSEFTFIDSESNQGFSYVVTSKENYLAIMSFSKTLNK